MGKVVNKVKEDIVNELKDLRPDNLKEVLDFICFLKVKGKLDPSQAYFWTKTWQKREKEVNEDKIKGRVIGNGTVESLLESIKT